MVNHTNHTRSGCRPGLAQRHPAIAAAFPDSDSQAVGRRAVESLCQGGIPGLETSGFSRLRILGMMMAMVMVVMMMMNFDFNSMYYFPGGLNTPNTSC